MNSSACKVVYDDENLRFLRKKFTGKWRLAGSKIHLKYVIDLGEAPSNERIVYDAMLKIFTYYKDRNRSWSNLFESKIIASKEVKKLIKLQIKMKNFK